MGNWGDCPSRQIPVSVCPIYPAFYEVISASTTVRTGARSFLPDGRSRISRVAPSAHAVDQMNFAAMSTSPPNGSPGTAGAWRLKFGREGHIAAVQSIIDLILAACLPSKHCTALQRQLPTSFDPRAFYCQLQSLPRYPLQPLLAWGIETARSSNRYQLPRLRWSAGHAWVASRHYNPYTVLSRQCKNALC